MIATDLMMPRSIFKFSGQMHLDTLSIKFEKVPIDFHRYNDLAIKCLRLAMEATRLHAG
jgi:hypothetical protein